MNWRKKWNSCYFTMIYVWTLTSFTHTICDTDLNSWCGELRMNKAQIEEYSADRTKHVQSFFMRKRERDVSVETITLFISLNFCLSSSYSMWICAFVFVHTCMELLGAVLLLLECCVFFVNIHKAICIALTRL